MYCSSELTALSQPNSARHTTPSAQNGIRLKKAMAINEATVAESIISPGRALCARLPLVSAPNAAPSGIAAYSRPICEALICHSIASAG
ncbi:hypothetical protein D3C78_1434250 [compost metagenome]